MLEYLADGSRSYSEPYFTVSEVVYSEISKYVVVVLLVASKDLCGRLIILSREYVHRLVLNKLNRVRSQVTTWKIEVYEKCEGPCNNSQYIIN